MDFGALPPEINSGLMYSGSGSGTMLAAAAAWGSLAAELHTAAASYGSVISGLTDGPWQGPASASMAAAAMPYVTWLGATAAQAEQAQMQAGAAANAYHAAFAMTVPPPVIAANRAQLLALMATNFFGQNGPAIAATEALYAEMWAQDATAMYGYAANSAAASTLTPLTSPPQTSDPGGQARQGAAVAQAVGTAASQQPSATQLLSPTAAQANPLASSTSTVVNPSTGEPVPTGTTSGLDALLQPTTMASLLPGYVMMANTPVFAMSGLMSIGEQFAQWSMRNSEAAATQIAADESWVAADSAWESGAAGAWAGVGESASVGALSVPQSWGWTAATLDMLPPGVPFALPAIDGMTLSAADFGAGMGAPMLFGGLPRAAGVAAAAGAGAAAVKYGSRLTVMARPPAAGYASDQAGAPTPAQPVHAGYTTHGNPPPGYRAAVVYVPAGDPVPATS